MDQLLSNTLREKRERILVNDYRPIIELAKKENRGFTSDERTKLDVVDVELDAIDKDIARAERAEKRELELARPVTLPFIEATSENGETPEMRAKKAADYNRAFVNYVRYGMSEITPEERAILKTGFVAND